MKLSANDSAVIPARCASCFRSTKCERANSVYLCSLLDFEHVYGDGRSRSDEPKVSNHALDILTVFPIATSEALAGESEFRIEAS